MRSLKNERFGNALEWAIRSADNIFVTSVADIFLNVSKFRVWQQSLSEPFFLKTKNPVLYISITQNPVK